jgi:hypothetical protein
MLWQTLLLHNKSNFHYCKKIIGSWSNLEWIKTFICMGMTVTKLFLGDLSQSDLWISVEDQAAPQGTYPMWEGIDTCGLVLEKEPNQTSQISSVLCRHHYWHQSIHYGQAQWHMSITPATQETVVRGQTRQKVSKTPSQPTGQMLYYAPIIPAMAGGHRYKNYSARPQAKTQDPTWKKKTKAKKGWEHG